MAKKPSKVITVAKRKPKAGAAKASIAVVRHAEKRANIPTEELRDFVREDDQKKPVLYPRNPDLDPQLVWKGKDEQDASPLEVPAVPVYIQEKIHPRAIIEDFRRTAPSSAAAPDPGLFDTYAAFNGLPESFDKRVDFYRYEGNWSNRLILGDSLLIMASLAEKEGLKGKVQCVYFDPPYGIKFGSNWQVSTRKRDVKDGSAEDVVRQPEQMRAFRDTWELGIHSYLSYLRDRLAAARDLLTESGSVFVQIGDENVHLVRSVLDEVFGSENWIGLISVQKTTSATNNYLPLVSDYLVWYAKDAKHTKYRPFYQTKALGESGAAHYTGVELPDGTRRGATVDERRGAKALPDGARLFTPDNLQSASMGRTKGEGAACWFPVEINGRKYLPSDKSRWKTNEEGIARLKLAGRVIAQDRALRYVRYIDDFPAYPLHNLWTDVGGAADKTYVVETTPEVVKRCLLMTTDPGDLVLDPTCGSGTTAYVAEQWGRRWITTDTSRVALTLARTRLMSARFPYYHLADQYPLTSGMREEAEIKGALKAAPAVADDSSDVRKGFVYKRVPHVTLKSIANNPDIREGMSRKEIDEAIARHAETEFLFDRPYEDPGRIRVTGPFTVESLSPHRTISFATRDAESRGEVEGVSMKVIGPDEFGRMVLEQMKKAGVQNTYAKERMVFETLEPYAGEWIQGSGEYTDKGGKRRRVAVCIGPEHGTVGPELVKAAAKEAVKGVGFDTLLIAGFAFDPHVGEEVKRYGSLTVLPVRINADLAMADLLKKTGGNLFMIFGEPDITIRPPTREELTEADAKCADYRVVEIRGLDVYDPTTGEIRASSTDDIACWFIDTDYNDEAFFVRHAYFTGADDPYKKLKRALRAEIDEAAWSALYSTTSRPFRKPETGKIAVKVINHYGDEVLQVYSVK